MYKFLKFFKITSNSVNNCIRITLNMLNSFITPRTLHLLIPIVLAILTTDFLRLQLLTGLPEWDGGYYTFASQYIYSLLSQGKDITVLPLHLYQLMVAWVFGIEGNQFIMLRLIDGLVAIVASILLFKVILKESRNTLFTIILMIPLLIMMNNIQYIGFGFWNSIWASYIPLFAALLAWQKSSKKDSLSFYLIGGLISLGVLLREPFLVYFIFAGIAIHISYGWRILLKYLIGSAAPEIISLRALYVRLNYNKDKFAKAIEKHRPTLIVATTIPWAGDLDIPSMVEQTNLYNKVDWVPKNPDVHAGWMTAIIYRLKDFK